MGNHQRLVFAGESSFQDFLGVGWEARATRCDDVDHRISQPDPGGTDRSVSPEKDKELLVSEGLCITPWDYTLGK